jgi:hypothetical protein
VGFKAPKSKLKLKFAAEEFAGFEVVMRRMTFNDTVIFDDGKLRELRRKVNDGAATAEDIDAHMAAMHEALVAAITEWNLEDDAGNEVPISVATLRSQEIDFFWTLVYAWISSMALQVNDDTKAPSSDGKPSEELSIPMEPLSEPQAS